MFGYNIGQINIQPNLNKSREQLRRIILSLIKWLAIYLITKIIIYNDIGETKT